MWAVDLMIWASVGFVTTLLHGVGSFVLLFVAAGGTFFVQILLVGFVFVHVCVTSLSISDISLRY